MLAVCSLTSSNSNGSNAWLAMHHLNSSELNAMCVRSVHTAPIRSATCADVAPTSHTSSSFGRRVKYLFGVWQGGHRSFIHSFARSFGRSRIHNARAPGRGAVGPRVRVIDNYIDLTHLRHSRTSSRGERCWLMPFTWPRPSAISSRRFPSNLQSFAKLRSTHTASASTVGERK